MPDEKIVEMILKNIEDVRKEVRKGFDRIENKMEIKDIDCGEKRREIYEKIGTNSKRISILEKNQFKIGFVAGAIGFVLGVFVSNYLG